MEDQVTELLKEERKLEEIESFEENKINWIELSKTNNNQLVTFASGEIEVMEEEK